MRLEILAVLFASRQGRFAFTRRASSGQPCEGRLWARRDEESLSPGGHGVS